MSTAHAAADENCSDGRLPSINIKTKFGNYAYLVCRSEGNCNADGTLAAKAGGVPNPYCGHKDPGNSKTNIGFCSNQNGSTNESDANRDCMRMINDGLTTAKNAGYNPDSPGDVSAVLNFIDLNIQAPAALDSFAACLAFAKNGKLPWKAPNLSSCAASGTIQGDDPILNARVCSYLVPSGGKKAPDINDLSTARMDYFACPGGRPENCLGAFCDQARRMSELGADGSGGINGGTQAAESQEKLLAQFLQCWSCDLLEALTVGGILTGEKVYDKLRSALIALILAVQGLFALWYVFKVMQPFGADGRVSGVFNEYASNLFVAFFICLVLASSGFFWKYLYIPVLSGAMDLSGTIVSAANNPQLNSCAPVAGGDLPNVAKSLGARLSCQVRGVSEGVGSGVTIGWAMWNRMTLIAEGTRIDLKAWTAAGAGAAAFIGPAGFMFTGPAGLILSPFFASGIISQQVASLLDRINLFFSGGALMAVFFYASLIYVFGVMEVILRWTVIALASPLMIASYAFKQTRGMAFWGLKGMFESLMSLAMMSVVALIAIALVTESMEKQAQRDAVITATSTTATTPQPPATATPAPQATTAAKVSPQIASIESLVTKIETDKDYKGVPTMNTLAFWELITVGLLIGGLMQRMPAIARQLIGGAGASMPNTVQWGQTVGNRAASFAGSSARAVGSVSASVVGSGLRRLTGR